MNYGQSHLEVGARSTSPEKIDSRPPLPAPKPVRKLVKPSKSHTSLTLTHSYTLLQQATIMIPLVSYRTEHRGEWITKTHSATRHPSSWNGARWLLFLS